MPDRDRSKSRRANPTREPKRAAAPACPAPEPNLEPEGPPGAIELGAGSPFDAERKLRELEFLHEFAKLLTTASNWDELMRTTRSAPSTSSIETGRACAWPPPTGWIAIRWATSRWSWARA
jgi:hypothetical protein